MEEQEEERDDSWLDYAQVKGRLEQAKLWRAHVDDLRAKGVKWPRTVSACPYGCDKHSFMQHDNMATFVYDMEPHY